MDVETGIERVLGAGTGTGTGGMEDDESDEKDGGASEVEVDDVD